MDPRAFRARYGKSASFRERREIFRDVALRARAAGTLCFDLGCGPGVLSAAFVELGVEVIGVDSSPAMIAEAGATVPGALFVEADARGVLEGETRRPALIVCSTMPEY